MEIGIPPKTTETGWRRQDRAPMKEIQTIVGSFTRGGITRSSRKAYARQMRYKEVYLVEIAQKRQRSINDSLVISFVEADQENVI